MKHGNIFIFVAYDCVSMCFVVYHVILALVCDALMNTEVKGCCRKVQDLEAQSLTSHNVTGASIAFTSRSTSISNTV